MALRIRKDGRILCAAMHPEEPGDTYIDDGLHYQLSCEHKVIVTEENEKHKERGEWWWVGNIPKNIIIDNFYLKNVFKTLKINKIMKYYLFEGHTKIIATDANKSNYTDDEWLSHLNTEGLFTLYVHQKLADYLSSLNDGDEVAKNLFIVAAIPVGDGEFGDFMID